MLLIGLALGLLSGFLCGFYMGCEDRGADILESYQSGFVKGWRQRHGKEPLPTEFASFRIRVEEIQELNFQMIQEGIEIHDLKRGKKD